VSRYFIIDLERTREIISWWKPANWGYTLHLTGAGHYPQRQAEDIVRGARGMEIAVPVGQAAALANENMQIEASRLDELMAIPGAIIYEED
jgi:hypothetical protein